MYSFFKVKTDPSLIDIIAAYLSSKVESEGIHYREDGFDFYVLDHDQANQVESHLLEINNQFPLTFELQELENKNWNAEWESDFEAVEVRNFCRVRAPFHSPKPEFDYDIIIHPGMAFGTGHHETTWQMIDQLSILEVKNASVLDAGCGTGVLAILASMLEARTIDAFDFDVNAVESSRHNAELNKVANVNVFQSTVEKIENKQYDLILANINRNVIVSNFKALKSMLNNNGKIVLSGYLIEDRGIIEDLASTYDLNLLRTSTVKDWVCQVYSV